MMRLILISILLFTISCSNLEEKIPPEAYPEQVAGFKRSMEESGNTLIYTNYEKENVGSISLKVTLEKNAEDASRKWSVVCNSEDIYFAKLYWVLLNRELKDKAGKTVGAIRICRMKDSLSAYSWEIKKDKLTMRMDTRTTSDKTLKNITTLTNQNDFLEFAKTILSNINVDFDSLNIADTEAVEKQSYQKWIDIKAETEAVNKEFYQAWKTKDKAKIAQLATDEVAKNPILENIPTLKYEFYYCYWNEVHQIQTCYWVQPKAPRVGVSVESGYIGDSFKVVKIDEVILGEDNSIKPKNQKENLR